MRRREEKRCRKRDISRATACGGMRSFGSALKDGKDYEAGHRSAGIVEKKAGIARGIRGRRKRREQTKDKWDIE
jgi:hypothetical protein